MLAQTFTCSQTHVRTNEAFSSTLQDLIPTLAGIKHISDNTSQSRD